MNLRSLTLIITAIVLAAAGCNPAKAPVAVNKSTPQPARSASTGHNHDEAAAHDAPRITLAEAKKDFDAGTAVFIDTHSPEQYAQRHIPGSINVPANDMQPYLNKIPKGKKIIAYCS